MEISLSSEAIRFLLELYAGRQPPAGKEICQELVEKGLLAEVGQRVELTIAGWTMASKLAAGKL